MNVILHKIFQKFLLHYISRRSLELCIFMNKSNFSDIITVLTEKIFLSPYDSNETNIAIDIFIISKEDVHKR